MSEISFCKRDLHTYGDGKPRGQVQNWLLSITKYQRPWDWELSAFPANRERQEITWAGPCRQVCGLRVTFVRLVHAPEVSDLTQGFLHPTTSQCHCLRRMRLFRTFLLIDYRILLSKKRNFEDNISAKIEGSGWMNTNVAAVSYLPRILIPRCGQTGNVKPLTANRSLSFAVKWPNLDLKVSIITKEPISNSKLAPTCKSLVM